MGAGYPKVLYITAGMAIVSSISIPGCRGLECLHIRLRPRAQCDSNITMDPQPHHDSEPRESLLLNCSSGKSVESKARLTSQVCQNILWRRSNYHCLRLGLGKLFRKRPGQARCQGPYNRSASRQAMVVCSTSLKSVDSQDLHTFRSQHSAIQS